MEIIEKNYKIVKIKNFTYEIEVTDKELNIWIYKEEYGLKMHCMGFMKPSNLDEFIEWYIENNYSRDKINYLKMVNES